MAKVRLRSHGVFLTRDFLSQSTLSLLQINEATGISLHRNITGGAA
jgi:hypothetical protein